MRHSSVQPAGRPCETDAEALRGRCPREAQTGEGVAALSGMRRCLARGLDVLDCHRWNSPGALVCSFRQGQVCAKNEQVILYPSHNPVHAFWEAMTARQAQDGI